jgi:hypothetical protein
LVKLDQNFAFIFLLLSAMLIIFAVTLPRSSLGLQQVAGPILVRINPGETKYFFWGLLTDKNQSNTVNLTADGTGAEFLSLPQSIVLNPGNMTYVQGNITIPEAVPLGIQLKPAIHAIEVGEDSGAGGSIVNVQMSKILSIIIGQNVSTLDRK